MNDEDLQLLHRSVAGDRDALGALLLRHGPVVEEQLRIGNRWRGMLDSGDVMQVTYVEAFLHIASFVVTPTASFPAWLRRIAENNLRDAIRALESRGHQPKQRAPARPAEDSHFGLLDMLIGSQSTPSVAARAGEARDLLNAALNRLPNDYAQAVRLFDLEGKSAVETAEALGRSVGAAYMLRLRAHDRLRELLGPASQFLDTSA